MEEHNLKRNMVDNMFDGDSNEHVCEICLSDNKRVESVSFCVECVDYMCIECRSFHRKNKATRLHTILQEFEMPLDANVFKRIKQATCCPNHSEEEVTHKCVDHDEYVCIKCTVRNHRQCHNVEEVSTTAEVTLMKQKALNILCDLKHLGEKLCKSAKDNDYQILELMKEANEADLQRNIFFTKLYETLRKQDEQLSKDIQQTVQSAVLRLKKSISKFDQLKTKEEECIGMLDEASKYLNGHRLSILLQKSTQLLREIKTSLGDENTSRSLGISFKPSIDITAFQQTCKIISKDRTQISYDNIYGDADKAKVLMESTYHFGNKENRNGSPRGNNLKSSGELDKSFIPTPQLLTSVSDNSIPSNPTSLLQQPSSTQTSLLQLPCNPVMSQTSPTKRNIALPMFVSVRCSSDKNKCSIYGCLKLQNGNYVLIDNANKKIKMFDCDFKFLSATDLQYCPVNVCGGINNNIAVIFSNCKIISLFNITDKTASFARDIHTQFQPRAISCGDEGLAVLYTSTEEDAEIVRRIKVAELHIYPFTFDNVTIKKSFYVNKSCQSEIQEATSVLILKRGDVLIGNKERLYCFTTNGEMIWYVKSIRDAVINDVRSIAIDNRKFVYICSGVGNNVHQISQCHYSVRQVLISDVPSPRCIAVDIHRDWIVIGIENSDDVQVFEFKN